MFSSRASALSDALALIKASHARTNLSQVGMATAPRRRGVLERLFEGWSKESWVTWWPM